MLSSTDLYNALQKLQNAVDMFVWEGEESRIVRFMLNYLSGNIGDILDLLNEDDSREV